MGLLDIGVKKAAPISAKDLASSSGADDELIGTLAATKTCSFTDKDSASNENVGRHGNIQGSIASYLRCQSYCWYLDHRISATRGCHSHVGPLDCPGVHLSSLTLSQVVSDSSRHIFTRVF